MVRTYLVDLLCHPDTHSRASYHNPEADHLQYDMNPYELCIGHHPYKDAADWKDYEICQRHSNGVDDSYRAVGLGHVIVWVIVVDLVCCPNEVCDVSILSFR